jgi:hypothetical protein
MIEVTPAMTQWTPPNARAGLPKTLSVFSDQMMRRPWMIDHSNKPSKITKKSADDHWGVFTSSRFCP